MGFCPHIEVDEIAVGCGVLECDGFRQRITGHDVLEVLEQIGFRVLAAGLKLKAGGEARKGDGGICRESRGRKAHHEQQHQNERN